MLVLPENCESWWDLGTPEWAAALVVEVYGDRAVFSAAECALAATADGRDEDYRFWIAVFECLKARQAAFQAVISPIANA